MSIGTGGGAFDSSDDLVFDAMPWHFGFGLHYNLYAQF